jgi:hypothetical protein
VSELLAVGYVALPHRKEWKPIMDPSALPQAIFVIWHLRYFKGYLSLGPRCWRSTHDLSGGLNGERPAQEYRQGLETGKLIN